MSNPEILKDLTKILKTKKSPIEVCMLIDAQAPVVTDFIKTSSIALNSILGGGIPCGRIVEIFGEESNGKSSLVADIAANCQKQGGNCLIIDSEQVFSPARAKAMGADISNFFYSSETTVEGAFELIDYFLGQINETAPDCLNLILWDSIAWSTTERELEEDMDATQMGLKARLIGKGLRKLSGRLTNRTSLVFVNQVRTKMGDVGWGPKTAATGGMAMRYNTSIRLELKKIGNVKVDDVVTGINCRATTIKNKITSPARSSEFIVNFAGGIDDSEFILNLLVKNNIIIQSGPWYKFKEKKFHKKDFKIEVLKDPEIQESINKILNESIIYEDIISE